jgi:hypothetical protein
MFLAIINDDDEADAQQGVDEVTTPGGNSGGGKSSHWHRYQNAALKKIADEEFREDDLPGKRQLIRYRFRDHLKVAFRSTLENLVVFPFWAIKVLDHSILIYFYGSYVIYIFTY